MTRGASESAVYALTILGLVMKLLGPLCRLLEHLMGVRLVGLIGNSDLLGASIRAQLGPLLVLMVHYIGTGILKNCRWETS